MPFVFALADVPVERVSPLEWVAEAVFNLVGFSGCSSSVPTGVLVAHRVAERVEIYALRHKGLPERLQDVFLDEPVPTDPWGNDWSYRAPGVDGARFDLVSAGPDGRLGTDDDLGPLHW